MFSKKSHLYSPKLFWYDGHILRIAKSASFEVWSLMKYHIYMNSNTQEPNHKLQVIGNIPVIAAAVTGDRAQISPLVCIAL